MQKKGDTGNEKVNEAIWFLLFRVPAGPNGPSGFGFELTFRLKKEPTETAPPTWPAELMQGLARYVFQSGENEILFC